MTEVEAAESEQEKNRSLFKRTAENARSRRWRYEHIASSLEEGFKKDPATTMFVSGAIIVGACLALVYFDKSELVAFSGLILGSILILSAPFARHKFAESRAALTPRLLDVEREVCRVAQHETLASHFTEHGVPKGLSVHAESLLLSDAGVIPPSAAQPIDPSSPGTGHLTLQSGNLSPTP